VRDGEERVRIVERMRGEDSSSDGEMMEGERGRGKNGIKKESTHICINPLRVF
jgi:hypothetical protein